MLEKHTDSGGPILPFFVCGQDNVLYTNATLLQRFGYASDERRSVSFRKLAEYENTRERCDIAE